MSDRSPTAPEITYRPGTTMAFGANIAADDGSNQGNPVAAGPAIAGLIAAPGR